MICILAPSPVEADPCSPNPCGPNSACREVDGVAACACLRNYIGRPPSCRPECVVTTDCPTHLACLNKKCTDPCEGVCGLGAECQVSNHNPQCSCPTGYSGDPFQRCSVIPVSKLNHHYHGTQIR